MATTNPKRSFQYNPRDVRIDIRWDGRAFDIDVTAVGFEPWTGVANRRGEEVTLHRGRRGLNGWVTKAQPGAMALAAELAASYGGTVYLNGVPFLSSIEQRADNYVRLIETRRNWVRPVALEAAA